MGIGPGVEIVQQHGIERLLQNREANAEKENGEAHEIAYAFRGAEFDEERLANGHHDNH